MALSPDNPWWMEVLENGPGSPYAIFFDIDWHPPNRILEGKLLLPILGRTLRPGPGGPGTPADPGTRRLFHQLLREQVSAGPQDLPADPGTRPGTAGSRTGRRESGHPGPHGHRQPDHHLPPRLPSSPKKVKDRHRDKEIIKKNLWLLYQANPVIKKFLDENITLFNGRAGDPESFNLLDRLLSLQPYRLSYWRVSLDMINYRRFFSVNDLIGLRVEDPRVFEASHSLLFNLIREGKVSGVRIDHIDGLYDPLGYLQRLQSRLAPGDKAPADRESFYVVVEKILAADEPLPPEWPVAGTTGYDFLNTLNGLFIDANGFQEVQQVYNRFVQPDLPRAELVYQKKKLVMETLFEGEMESLGYILSLLAEQDRQARDVPRKELQKIIGEVIARLPVYRTYIRSFEVGPQDRACLEKVIAEVRTQHPSFDPTALDFVHRVLLLDVPPNLSEEHREDWLRFVMRWQQFTVPVMAKGLEDTALYVYNPLISLNEVGTDFLVVAPEDFHRFNQGRRENWPFALNATTTHDTKRSEDVRLRINVLSEIPREWEACLQRWSAWNACQEAHGPWPGRTGCQRGIFPVPDPAGGLAAL